MCRIIGFALFWIAVGMLLMMLISNVIAGVILVLLLLIVSYNLFCIKK